MVGFRRDVVPERLCPPHGVPLLPSLLDSNTQYPNEVKFNSLGNFVQSCPVLSSLSLFHTSCNTSSLFGVVLLATGFRQHPTSSYLHPASTGYITTQYSLHGVLLNIISRMVVFVDLEEESESEPPEHLRQFHYHATNPLSRGWPSFKTNAMSNHAPFGHRWGANGAASLVLAVARGEAGEDVGGGRQNPNRNKMTEALGCYP